MHVLACATEYRQETAILQRSAARNGCSHAASRAPDFSPPFPWVTPISFHPEPRTTTPTPALLLPPSPTCRGFRFHTVGLGEPWRGFATKFLAYERTLRRHPP